MFTTYAQLTEHEGVHKFLRCTYVCVVLEFVLFWGGGFLKQKRHTFIIITNEKK